jgi:hypothetical protein
MWACPVIEQTTNKTVLQNSGKDGLSTGSVLVIIFVVFATLYFVGGAVALRLIRGAEGREMIPNYDFWVDLPNLVKVSIFFKHITHIRCLRGINCYTYFFVCKMILCLMFYNMG